MKKFVFPLQGLLKFRLQEEKSIKEELLNKRIILQRLTDELKELELKKDFQVRLFSEQMQSGIYIEKVNYFNAYLAKLNSDINDKNIKIEKCNEQCEILLNKLAEIKKAIKMLETLKEKKLNEYLEEEKKEENKIVDEYINYRLRSLSI